MNELRFTYIPHGKKVRLVCRFGYKEWDDEKGKYYRPPFRYTTELRWSSFPNRGEISKNKEIIKLQNQITIAYQNLIVVDDINCPSPKILSKELDRILNNRPHRNGAITIVDWISDYVKRNPDRVKKNTLKQHKTLIGFISGFEEQIERDNLKFEDFDSALYNNLIDYSQERLKSQAGVWSKHKELKRMLNAYSRETGIEVFNPTKELSQTQKKAISYKTGEKLALTWDQVNQIIETTDLSDELLNTRNAFLHLVFTGVRYSDLKELKPTTKGEKFEYFNIQTEKTGTEIIIPVLKPLVQLRDKYGFPKILSNQKLNHSLKELGEACGLNEPILLYYYNTKSKRKKRTAVISKELCTHTGRRTFITNLIDYIPMTVLASITGHSIKSISDDMGILLGYREKNKLKNAELFVSWLEKIQVDHKDQFPIALV